MCILKKKLFKNFKNFIFNIEKLFVRNGVWNEFRNSVQKNVDFHNVLVNVIKLFTMKITIKLFSRFYTHDEQLIKLKTSINQKLNEFLQ